MQDMIIETSQAMNSIQFAMARSVAVTDLALDTVNDLAQQAIDQLLPAASSMPPVPSGSIIDTYA